MRFVFVGNGFLLHALPIFFFQILWKVLQVLRRNSVHNVVLFGEVPPPPKKASAQKHLGCPVYDSVFSGNLLFPKIEYKNVNDFV